MILSDKEIKRLFWVRKTLLEMLRDRGYSVGDSEINITKDQFIQKFGENMNRAALTILVSKLDSSDQIYVLFPKEATIGPSELKDMAKNAKSDNVFRAILVIHGKLTPKGQRYLNDTSSPVHLEVFKESELLVNIMEHALVPEHQVLTTEEKKDLLEKYTVKETQLPRIQVTDPVARYYGLKRGQVVKILRASETAGRYITYRYVV
ncbi:DNA-directed RNA polymerases II and IV subunit 5A-like [Rutidosis leptorrhynchoides]|uniref:DNA-directed RNA polymerases II and IV subunit 5A-like n=1 Tax=Rutidosis leptorrhynchoides TaxID=125765 RepID=UPI003A9912A0